MIRQKSRAYPSAGDFKKIHLAITVGVFVIVGILCISYLSIKLGKLELFGGDYHEVSADFDSVSGLKPGASVEIAGVEVGRVEGIMLDPKQVGRARVYLRLEKTVQLQDDTTAAVRTRGLIGDKFIMLKPGDSNGLIPPGGTIKKTESTFDLEDLLGEFIQGGVLKDKMAALSLHHDFE